MEVLNHSARSGATLIQNGATKQFTPGSDEWLPVQNPDGSYSFYNFNSQLALDVPGASSESATQLDQSFGNGTTAQKFNLIPQ